MNLEDYTPDNICRTFGFPGFSDSSFVQLRDAVRVVLCPSFHPEICITITRSLFDVRVFSAMLWVQPSIQFIPSFVCTNDGRSDTFASLHAAAWNVTELPASHRKTLCLDGMRYHCAIVQAGEVRHLSGNAICRNELTTFLPPILIATHESAIDHRIKNGIADAASYMDIDLPRFEVPTPTRVAVLGTESDRTEYLETLKAVTKTANTEQPQGPAPPDQPED